MGEAIDIEIEPIWNATGADLAVISAYDPAAMVKHSAECRDKGLRFVADPSQQITRMDGDALKQLIDDAGGYYSYWETGRRASLRELMINEGLATIASRAISPGHAAWEYYGYTRREYASVRELEPVMTRALNNDLDRAGLGLRLRYLSGGMSDDARTVDRHIFPERSGYYLGTRMVEPAVDTRGLPWAIRASASEITSIASSAAASA